MSSSLPVAPRAVLAPILGAALLLAAPPAQAQDAISMEVVRHGQEGGPTPALKLKATESLDYAVTVACGAAKVDRSGSMGSGDTVTLPLATGRGRHTCQGQLEITLGDGSSGAMPLRFEVEHLSPLVVEVPRGHVDLAAGTMRVHADRPIAAVEVELFGEDGPVGGGRTENSGPPGPPVAASWMPLADNSEVVRVHVKVVDSFGFWGAVDLFPWYYEVPHEDVVFATNQATIDPAEVPKLDEAWTRMEAVVERYGKVAPVNLYVAGYTDTVGNAAANQKLSEARARAIAGWFRDKGFSGAIHYQGFGEKGLAVGTPDETDEPRNRRAGYIVAAEAPPVTGSMPASAWRPLR